MSDLLGNTALTPVDRPRVRVPAGSAAVAALGPFMGLGGPATAPADAVPPAPEPVAATKAKAAKSESDDDDDCDCDPEDDDCDCDDDEGEMHGKSEAARARRRERARIRSVVNSAAGKANPALALQLALTTSIGRKQAVAALRGMPAASAATLADRMATQQRPRQTAGGADAPANPAAAIEASWDKVMSKVSHRR